MDRNEQQIPYSALFTAATWQWAELPAAKITTPEGSDKLFRIVRGYNNLYRLLNPDTYQLHEMLLHRHLVINRLIRENPQPRIIEVAAGLSPRGCQFSQSPDTEYVEVDLRQVVKLKRSQLLKSAEGTEVLARMNFHLIEGDITSPSLWHGFSSKASTVITEGLMMYFNRKSQMDIWKQIALFTRLNGGEYLFDYIPLELTPKRSFVGKLLSGLRRLLLNNRTHYYPDNRHSDAIVADLRAAGFSKVEKIRCSSVAWEWQLPFPEADSRVMIFRCR